MSRIARCCLAGIVTAALAQPAEARSKPEGVAPAKKRGKQRRAERRAKDNSNGGQRKGGIEFTLGAATAALAVVLVGRGAWEYSRLKEFERDCAAAGPFACEGSLEPLDYKIATGLSFGFAVPAALASTFLFIYAVRINRDYKKFMAEQARLQVTPLLGKRSGGMSLRLRF